MKTVAKVSSNLFQVENRVESIICCDKLREISCVNNTCFEEFSGTLSCLVERKAGAVSYLPGIWSGLRPRVLWSAGISLVVTCFHWKAFVEARIFLSRFATKTGCFLVVDNQSSTTRLSVQSIERAM